jgi:hypothetical protein
MKTKRWLREELGGVIFLGILDLAKFLEAQFEM